MKRNKIIRRIVLAITFLFFYFPILYIMVFSFNSARSLSVFEGFSLKWYQAVFADPSMIKAIYYTIVVALLSTAISTVVGTITAIGLSKSKKILVDIVKQVNNLPIMNPDIVTAVGLMLFFVSLNVQKGFITLLLAHVAFSIPYVILTVLPKLKSLNPNLLDAALDLGATPFKAMTKILIPEIMPAIISGALIAFTMSFDDFTISYFVTGNGINNISTLVWNMSKRINPSINALSTIIIAIITLTLIIINIFPIYKNHRKEKGKPLTKRFYISLCTGIVLFFVGVLYFLKGGISSPLKSKAIEKYGSDTLKVFAWGEYIDPEVIKNFEKEFGVTVILDTYDSNEIMYTKLQTGESYDVLLPSDYMIERLIEEEYLQKLDKNTVTNLDLLSEHTLGLDYDPNNDYSVPYFYGTVGILYNINEVDLTDLEEQGWEILKNSKYKSRIFFYDSERDSFMVALKALGYSMNTSDENEISEAYEWLIDLVQNNDPMIVGDEVIDAMISGNKDIAIVYSGDATYIISENEELDFYLPTEGTNLWSDSFVIPANAENPKLANEFINYMCEYEPSYINGVYVGYTPANDEAFEELAAEEFEGISAFVPRSGYELDEVFRHNPEVKKIMMNYWTKVKVSY